MSPSTEKTFLKVQVTPEIMEALDRWKGYSGMSYSMTIRLAVLDYLADKIAEVPTPRPVPTQAGEGKKEEEALRAHFEAFILTEMHSCGNDTHTFRLDLEREIGKKGKELALLLGKPLAGTAMKEAEARIYELVKGNPEVARYLLEAIEPRTRRRS
jgi:hypothetical protein